MSKKQIAPRKTRPTPPPPPSPMTRPRRDAPTRSISPELIDQFQELLSTWPLREKQGKMTIKESDTPEGLG